MSKPTLYPRDEKQISKVSQSDLNNYLRSTCKCCGGAMSSSDWNDDMCDDCFETDRDMTDEY